MSVSYSHAVIVYETDDIFQNMLSCIIEAPL